MFSVFYGLGVVVVVWQKNVGGSFSENLRPVLAIGVECKWCNVANCWICCLEDNALISISFTALCNMVLIRDRPKAVKRKQVTTYLGSFGLASMG